jgi:hypothetical protein
MAAGLDFQIFISVVPSGAGHVGVAARQQDRASVVPNAREDSRPEGWLVLLARCHSPAGLVGTKAAISSKGPARSRTTRVHGLLSAPR